MLPTQCLVSPGSYVQNIFPVLHFLFSASPENGNNLAGAMSLEAIEYGFVETDSSTEHLETFPYISGPTNISHLTLFGKGGVKKKTLNIFSDLVSSP